MMHLERVAVARDAQRLAHEAVDDAPLAGEEGEVRHLDRVISLGPPCRSIDCTRPTRPASARRRGRSRSSARRSRRASRTSRTRAADGARRGSRGGRRRCRWSARGQARDELAAGPAAQGVTERARLHRGIGDDGGAHAGDEERVGRELAEVDHEKTRRTHAPATGPARGPRKKKMDDKPHASDAARKRRRSAQAATKQASTEGSTARRWTCRRCLIRGARLHAGSRLRAAALAAGALMRASRGGRHVSHSR